MKDAAPSVGSAATGRRNVLFRLLERLYLCTMLSVGKFKVRCRLLTSLLSLLATPHRSVLPEPQLLLERRTLPASQHRQCTCIQDNCVSMVDMVQAYLDFMADVSSASPTLMMALMSVPCPSKSKLGPWVTTVKAILVMVPAIEVLQLAGISMLEAGSHSAMQLQLTTDVARQTPTGHLQLSY